MILLLADGKPFITRSVLSGNSQKVAYSQIGSLSFSSMLDSTLKREDFELAVIECHVNEKACLPLITFIKKQRNDVPVVFVASTASERAITEAFKRGARDCFRNPFNLTHFKERIRRIRAFRNARPERRVPLFPYDEQPGDGPVLSSRLPEGIIKVLSFLEDRVADRKLTVAGLARVAGMSAFHFCRTFKKHTSHSPMRYVTRLRVERAKHMLTHHSGNMSVSQIATGSGFYDSSNLNRHFKRLTGLTPTAFVRSLG